jgi:hypothetical protein
VDLIIPENIDDEDALEELDIQALEMLDDQIEPDKERKSA